ncbi:MAG TPA: hypothetical protein VFV05_06320 [Methylomirabilota bacterium]|nr:hypothetical protein [Methylomirabilota bacterium]
MLLHLAQSDSGGWAIASHGRSSGGRRRRPGYRGLCEVLSHRVDAGEEFEAAKVHAATWDAATDQRDAAEVCRLHHGGGRRELATPLG